MRSAVAAAFLGMALVTPASAQVPNVQQLLKGLTNGNQNQDQALRDAFERGYERGRQDEARAERSRHGGGDNRDNRNSDNNRRDYQDQRGQNQRGLDQPQGNEDNNYGR